MKKETKKEIRDAILVLMFVFIFILIVDIIGSLFDIIRDKVAPYKNPDTPIYVCIDGYAFQKVSIDGGNYMYDPAMVDNTPEKCTELAEGSIKDAFERIK